MMLVKQNIWHPYETQRALCCKGYIFDCVPNTLSLSMMKSSEARGCSNPAFSGIEPKPEGRASELEDKPQGLLADALGLGLLYSRLLSWGREKLYFKKLQYVHSISFREVGKFGRACFDRRGQSDQQRDAPLLEDRSVPSRVALPHQVTCSTGSILNLQCRVSCFHHCNLRLLHNKINLFLR